MASDEAELAASTWTPEERESFFAAIARHRKAAARFDLITRVCALVFALMVAVLMSPLLYAILGLLLDLVNLLVPMPDLLGNSLAAIEVAVDNPESISAGRWLYLLGLAALPGAILMLLVLRTLDRIMREAMTSDAGNFAARAPNTAVLAEQRFANVVAEMAIAANLPAPRVLIVETAHASAAAFGDSDAHASVAISTGLLNSLNRSELQGVAAHLVGSIANGDMRVGSHVASTLGLFGLVSRLSDSFANREAGARFLRVLRAAARPGSTAEDAELAVAITNPFNQASEQRAQAAEPDRREQIRQWAWMPLTGPLVFSGFFGSLLSSTFLAPLLALLWRRRKYLADATAVQLTRDPDALAGALHKMRDPSMEGAFGACVAHMCLVDSGDLTAKNILSASTLRMFPPLEERLKALGTMGASVSLRPVHRFPLWVWLAGLPLTLLIAPLFGAVLVLLVLISVALSMIFTWLPAMLLHAILR